MSGSLEALLRAALSGTGIEIFVCDLAEDPLPRFAVDEGFRAAFDAMLQRAIETRASFEYEYRSGGKWKRIRGAFDGDLLAGTTADITLARARRSAFEQLVENIPDFIARVDLEGRFLYVNRATEHNAFGLPRSALIGKTPEELGFNPATARLLREAELRVIQTGEPQRFEIELEHNGGTSLDIYMLPERDEQGRLASILRITRDVTPLKESEKRQRESEERLILAARASVAMIYDWDMTTGTTYRSDAVRELTGFSPEETARSEWWIAGIHPDDRARAESRVRAAIEQGNDRYENEYRFRHRDGNWHWVWDRGFIVRDESGRAVRAVGSIVDITARRTAEEQLKAAHRNEQEARAEAERANRAKDEFLATLSHELRTPMTSILGWTSMLASGMVDERAMPLAVRSIHESAAAQAQLIEDLLDISRITSGKLSVETGPVDMITLVAATVESFRVAAMARSIDLRPSLEPSMLLILADEKRTRQVVANLINNALKFTSPGGRIDVALTSTEEEAVLTVRDSGAGIDPAFLPRVFDRFAQQETAPGHGQGGLGLGLAIVRQLVELQGGSVRAESEGRGRGSTFTVRMPRLAASLRATLEQPSPRVPPRLDGVRVLLVEDEPHSRTYLGSVLQSSGAEVWAAASVAEALGAETDASVVVSDIAMPGEDGLTLIAELRMRDARLGRRTPALAVTALGFGDDRRRILSAGFDEYLPKPVEPLVLLETVAALVRNTQ